MTTCPITVRDPANIEVKGAVSYEGFYGKHTDIFMIEPLMYYLNNENL